MREFRIRDNVKVKKAREGVRRRKKTDEGCYTRNIYGYRFIFLLNQMEIRWNENGTFFVGCLRISLIYE